MSRNSLTASMTRLIVVALWSVRYMCAAVMLASLFMYPRRRAISAFSPA